MSAAAGRSRLQLLSTSAIDSSEDAAETKTNSRRLPESSMSGPDLGDFIAGVVPREARWQDYAGQLRLDDDVVDEKTNKKLKRLRLPPWLKTKIPVGESVYRMKEDLRGLGLATVCEEARCPNIGECW